MASLLATLATAQGGGEPQGTSSPAGPGEAERSQASLQEQAGQEDEVDPESEPQMASLEEARPFEWSWESVFGVLSGRETFTASEGRVSFRLGGTLQVDGTTGTQSQLLEDSLGAIDSSLGLRRLRISSHGRVGDMNFMVSGDVGADLGFKDIWFEGQEGGLALYEHHLGKFRFGQMREPFGFESQTSSNFTAFMERSLPVQAFDPGRNVGMMVHDVSDNQRVHWSVGTFSLGSGSREQENYSLFSITGRVTGLPIASEDGASLLHVGGSISSRSPTRDLRYSARPEARFVDRFVDTGDIDSSGVNLYGLELAGVYRSLWAQAEWVMADVTAADVGDPRFSGGYLQVGWFLDEISRPYRYNGGTFDRFRPEMEDEGVWRPGRSIRRGTWELVGRVSRLDLDEGDVDGGVLTDLSAGVNLYTSASTRLQLNYIYSMPKDQGHASIFLLRFQYQPW